MGMGRRGAKRRKENHIEFKPAGKGGENSTN